jgi:hypothetical protein
MLEEKKIMRQKHKVNRSGMATYLGNTNSADKTQNASSIGIKSETSIHTGEFVILKRIDHASHGKGGP